MNVFLILAISKIEYDGSRGPQMEDDEFRGLQTEDNDTRKRNRPDFTPLAVGKPKGKDTNHKDWSKSKTITL